MSTPEQIRQIVLDCIAVQQERELRPGNYDVESSLYALSSVASLVEGYESPVGEPADGVLAGFMDLIYGFQCRYRDNPLDSDEYGGGGAVIGSVISSVISAAQEQGIHIAARST